MRSEEEEGNEVGGRDARKRRERARTTPFQFAPSCQGSAFNPIDLLGGRGRRRILSAETGTHEERKKKEEGE